MGPESKKSRRAYGTGRVYLKHGSYYGTWWVKGRRVNRKIGPTRRAGTREGLTRTQAEARLRHMIEQVKPSTPVERITFEDAGKRHVDRLEVLGRKASTIEDYRSHLRVHLNPAFGHRAINQVRRADIERFMMAKLRAGKSRKTVRNLMATLHGIFNYAARQEWIEVNPVTRVEKPRVQALNPDLKFLNLGELAKLLDAVPEDALGKMERVMYLAAAMTGMRQGETLGIRWMDVDWLASKIRIRQSLSRGRLGAPKSDRSSRSVPLADRVARELELHFQRSCWQADSDRVFCHPETGKPYDRSKCLKRFKDARDAAGVTKVTFHGLRHTFGTRMAAAGVPIRTIQEFMGHRDIQTTMIYAHYSPGEQEAELIARAFDPDRFQTGSNVSEHARTSADTEDHE